MPWGRVCTVGAGAAIESKKWIFFRISINLLCLHISTGFVNNTKSTTRKVQSTIIKVQNNPESMTKISHIKELAVML